MMKENLIRKAVLFKEYIELREVLDQFDEASLALPKKSWFQSIFGHEEKEPLQTSDAWKKLVRAYKNATDRAEKLKIMQSLNDMAKRFSKV